MRITDIVPTECDLGVWSVEAPPRPVKAGLAGRGNRSPRIVAARASVIAWKRMAPANSVIRDGPVGNQDGAVKS